MMTVLNISAVLLGLAALMLLAQWIAWLMTDARFHPCKGAQPLINCRPFNCRACLTLWMTAALLFGALILVGSDVQQSVLTVRYLVALIFAFINYFYIKTKLKVYE